MISVKKDFDKIPEVLLSDKEEAWKDKSVLDELKKIYHGKCAYCEQKTENLQVGHYRPKSRYPWLKNEWSNLLPACPECSSSKGNSFPIDGKPVLSRPENENKEDYRANSKYLLKEKPILIHPEIDTAENHFYFEKNGIIQGFTERGRRTVNILNLNRTFLTQKRLDIYNTLLQKLREKIISNLKKQLLKTQSIDNFFYRRLIEATNKKAEFSAFSKQICYQFEDTLYKEKRVNIIKDEDIGISSDNMNEEKKNDYADYVNNVYENTISKELEEYYHYIFELSYGFRENLKLPLSILGFSIMNFQGVKELSVNNIPLNTQWIFLTGENGFGKTSILKALLLGLIGKSEFRQNEINENIRIKLKLIERERIDYISLEKDQPRYNIFNSHIFSAQSNFVAAYGSKRTDFIPEASEIPVSDNLFEKTNKVLNTEFLLKTLDGNEKLTPFKEIIIQAFVKLIPRLSRIEFDADENYTSKQILYYEKDKEKNELPPVTFNQLAMGMRSIIGLVGDIIQRLSAGRGFRKEQRSISKHPFASLSDLYGIVIIDEFDNHLHPSWQRMLVRKLTDLFPKVQFIVSTHSPIALLGAPPDKTVILNVNRTKNEGITVRRLERIEKELPNLLPNTLLTSPIFGLDSIKSEYNKNIEDLNVDDNYYDEEKAKKINQEIDELLKKYDWLDK